MVFWIFVVGFPVIFIVGFILNFACVGEDDSDDPIDSRRRNKGNKRDQIVEGMIVKDD